MPFVSSHWWTHGSQLTGPLNILLLCQDLLSHQQLHLQQTDVTVQGIQSLKSSLVVERYLTNAKPSLTRSVCSLGFSFSPGMSIVLKSPHLQSDSANKFCFGIKCVCDVCVCVCVCVMFSFQTLFQIDEQQRNVSYFPPPGSLHYTHWIRVLTK